MPRLLCAALGLLAAFAAAAAAPQVELKTSAGVVVIELYPDKAPKTVENFLQYARDGFYDGTVFHRVIPGFMIQGGGFTADFKQKPARGNIRNEAENGLKNTVGTIAMARTSDPNSATAQFFINTNDNTFLNAGARDAGYTVFGKVVSGLDIVGNISNMPTGSGGPFPKDVPREMVIIEKATVVPPKK